MLDKLRKLLRWDAAARQSSASSAEARAHMRYRLEDFDFIRVEFPAEQFPRLRDISYGGFALVKTGFALPEFADPEIEGYFFLFNRSCVFKAKKIHEGRDKIGFQFIHASEAILIFLRSLLEDMRLGASLEKLDAVLLSESFQKKYTLGLRGDGAIDLYLDWQDGKLHRALLTQRSNGYQEVRFVEGQLHTARLVDQPGGAARMVTDDEADPAMLEKCLQIMVGALLKQSKWAEALSAFYEVLWDWHQRRFKESHRHAL